MARVDLLVALDRLLHLGGGGKRVVAARVARHQLGLELDEREQRRDGLGEPDEGEVVDPGLKTRL